MTQFTPHNFTNSDVVKQVKQQGPRILQNSYYLVTVMQVQR